MPSRRRTRPTGKSAPVHAPQQEVAPVEPGMLAGEADLSPDDVLDLQGMLSNQGVQAMLGRGASGPPPEAPAAGGPSPMRFPHAAAIQRSLGVQLPGEALLDEEAAEARGVPAFTEGDAVHFGAAAPPMEVAAHEAAHLLQHAGQASDLGLGPEGHAATVARAVQEGAPGADLISAAGPRVAGRDHPYTEVPVADQGASSALGWVNPNGRPLRVSDDGNIALDDNGFGDSQTAWGPASEIAASNSILQAQGSRVRLSAGSSTLSGKAPDGGQSRTLTSIDVTMADGSTPTTLTDDCGTAAHEVMGADNRISSAVIGDGSGGTTTTDPHRYVGGGGSPEPTAAESSFEEIMAREWPALTRDERYQKWGSLTATERDAFEQKYQVGRYAVPAVGQGITIASLYDTPGWQTQPQANRTWNFHYAANVLSAGHDYLTLENYAKHGEKNWYFWMSGPASKGQSFWDQHELQQGTSSTTLVVQPTSRVVVEVTNTAETDWWGDADLQVTVSTATGGQAQSDEHSVPVGGRHAFALPLERFLPQRTSEPIQIEIKENDVFSSSSLLSFTWNPPFDQAGAGTGATVSATTRME